MRRHAGPVVLLSMFLLVLMGVGIRRWEPVAVAMPVFVLYGLVIMTYSRQRTELSVERKLDPEVVYYDQKITVTIVVSNEHGTDLGLVEIFDELPDTCEIIEGKNHRLFTLGPYEEKTIKYKVKFHVLGDARIGPMRWRVRDHMSFFFDEGITDEITEVQVRRMVEDVRRMKVQPVRASRPFGTIPGKVKGMGSEFYGLRDYVVGDPFRIVNWKASARRGRLISKEFEDEKLGDVVLIVDMREVFKVGEGSSNTIDACVNGALAMAQKVLQERNRLSLVYFRKKVGWISGITSRRYIKELLDKGDFPGELEYYPIHWLPWIVKVSFPSKAYLIVLTPLMDDDMAKMLAEISLGGYDMLVISPSPASANVELYHKTVPDPAVRLSRKLVVLKRKNRMLRLAKTMTVIDWDFSNPLALALRERAKARGGARWRVQRRPAKT